jgi:hypothetical protein
MEIHSMSKVNSLIKTYISKYIKIRKIGAMLRSFLQLASAARGIYMRILLVG